MTVKLDGHPGDHQITPGCIGVGHAGRAWGVCVVLAPFSQAVLFHGTSLHDVSALEPVPRWTEPSDIVRQISLSPSKLEVYQAVRLLP